MNNLPVDTMLPDLARHMKSERIVIVEAPPGSGKTTRVAPSLIDNGLCDHQRRAFLLQPRRVAARATAQRISSERSWTLGSEVGYQVRFENRATESTPLVVATEGILIRRLANDPLLTNINTIVLDEFHERSLHADLLLGMLRRVQDVVRDDLRIIIMSATLDTQTLASQLNAPVLKSTGTLHPVEVKYRPLKPNQSTNDHVAETVCLTFEKTSGDILVFLPGVGEINRVQSALSKTLNPKACDILPLHGSLPLAQQNQALVASSKRRIILSTNVAETSLTIEGIKTVIDTGQVRVLRFQPDIGLDRLQLEPICRSSADQRAGRAGRLTDGTCIRLWDQKSHRARTQNLDPEIRRVDLSATILQMLQWGETPHGDFPWLEAPRPEALQSGLQLLELLGAVQENRITPLGTRMADLPIAPRLARMLVEAENFDAVHDIALVAAMISERDPFLRQDRGRSNRPPTRSALRWNCDVSQRYFALRDFLENGRQSSECGQIHRGAASTIQRVAKQLSRDFSTSNTELRLEAADQIEEVIRRCLLAGFPDRLARRRKAGDVKGRMVGGRGVRLVGSSGVTESEFFLCVDVDAGKTEANVRMASAVDLSWIAASRIQTVEEQFFNPTKKQVEARRRSYFADLLLAEAPMAISDEPQCKRLLLQEAKRNLASILPDVKSSFSHYALRMKCLRTWAPELDLPVCDEAMLLEIAGQLCHQRRSFAELRAAPWLDWLKAKLTAEQQQLIEKECPERIKVPSGSRIKIDYADGKPPVLAVRIQEVFSWKQTPRIAMGRIPILLHLLAPNMRAQQVTDDLASFWETTYAVVRKELRRRYPKHSWPEDPLLAQPEKKG